MAKTDTSATFHSSFRIGAFLFLFSLLLRCAFISKGPYHVDCLNLAVLSQETAATHQLNYLFGSGYPLAVILGAIFVKAGHGLGVTDPVTAVNWMGVVFGALAVVVFYFLSRKWLAAAPALLASLLFSVAPIVLGESVYGMSHPPALFFLLVAVYWLVRFRENPTAPTFFISAAAMGMMGATRIQDMLLVAVPVTYLLLSGAAVERHERSGARQSRWFLGFWFIAFSVALFFHLPYVLGPRQHVFEAQFQAYWGQGMLTYFKAFDPQSWSITFGYLHENFLYAGILVAAAGLLAAFQKRAQLGLFLLLWMVVPLCFYANFASTVPRFYLITMPAWYLAQGFCIQSLMAVPAKPFRYAAGLVFVMLFVLTFCRIYPNIKYRHDNADIVDYARWVGRHIEPQAFLITGDDDIFIHYYGRRQTLTRPINILRIDPAELEAFRQRLDALLANDTPVYVTAVGLFSYDPGGQFSGFMNRHYLVEYIGGHRMEDWHHGSLVVRTGWERVFRLYRR